MNQINKLRDILKPLLGWHGARVSFLALFLIALLRVKTINLAELATGFRHDAKISSNYKRLQRFFRHFKLDESQIGRIIVRLMDFPQPWKLSLDRTEWSFGKIRFNILMLVIVHEGVGYPVMWDFLDKKGNSNTDERIDLIERFAKIFPDAEIDYLCGDREFIGKEWLSYLLIEPTIRFRLRMRETDKISDGRHCLSAKIIFAHLQPGQREVLSSPRWVWGRLVYVSALRLEDKELLVILSPDSPQTAIADYSHRWGIETLFGMFKTRGFCLESTHFTDSERLSKLIALMSLALCWAMKVGDWLHSHHPLQVKKHGRLEKSIFRYGLDYLRSLVSDLDLKYKQFLNVLQFLSCT